MASLKKTPQEDTIMQEGQEDEGEGQWSCEDSHQLLINIMELLPQCDLCPYNIQEAQFDWDRVTFASFTADQCREHWNELSNNVRRYRTVSDLVVDALSLLNDPLSQAEKIETYNQMMDFKQDPINSFSLFTEVSENTPSQIPYRKRLKYVYQIYRCLSEEAKQWLLEHFDEVSRQSGGRSKKKRPSLKSVYRPHKSKLANPSSSRSRKKRSSMKSVSKPQNLKAMEEESYVSEESDNEEEITYPLSSESHFSLQSTSKPQKLKAANKKKKLYMSDHCDNGEGPSESTMKERKKKAIYIMNGLSRCVEDMIAIYRKKHPEMVEKVIVMELARKWEKLPDRRKNKYWKLALKKYVI